MQWFVTVLGIVFAVFVFGVVGALIEPAVRCTVDVIEDVGEPVVDTIWHRAAAVPSTGFGAPGSSNGTQRDQIEAEHEKKTKLLAEVEKLREGLKKDLASLQEQLGHDDFDVIHEYEREEN